MKHTLMTLSQRLALQTLQRGALAVAAALAAGMLAALAALCQEQVQRGERLRAEQRMASPVLVAAAPRQPR